MTAPARITVPLPPTYLLRDVTLRVERQGSRWVIFGVDGVGNAWPAVFDGFTGSVKFATKAGATEFLANHDAAPGDRVIARAVAS